MRSSPRTTSTSMRCACSPMPSWRSWVSHSAIAKSYYRAVEALRTAGTIAPPRSPDSYTPKHLAEKILTSKAALEGERKQVTVLFADLKGSMELLADRDPEEARKILDPVLERMMEAVHHYEGTVNQVMGDGIMALFGAPLAHEDHAVRACYAALRMQETVKRYAEGVRRARRRGGPDPRRAQLRRGRRARDRQRSAHGLHRGGPDHPPGRAHGAARHARDRSLLTADTLRLAEGYVEVEIARARHRQGPRRARGDLRADGSGTGADAPAGGGPARPHALRRPRRRGRAPAPGPRSGWCGPRPGGRHRRRGRGGQVAAGLRVHPLASGAGAG